MIRALKKIFGMDSTKRAARSRRGIERGPRLFSTIQELRSDSDDGTYVRMIRQALVDARAFATFKSNPRYQRVLEHLDEAQGALYLDCIRAEAPDLLGRMSEFSRNDLVGSPLTFQYPDVGVVSPTTLRYVKVASDLRRLFGEKLGRVVEIGVGYGGQLLIADIFMHFESYLLVDLPVVLELASRYLDSHVLRCRYETASMNRLKRVEPSDLVISNYAFSELPKPLQLTYVEKVLRHAPRGYLTMNTGQVAETRRSPRLMVSELRTLLPRFEILPETPSTGPDNYLIVWGHA